MTVDDMKELLSKELGGRVTWLLDMEGKPAKELSDIRMTYPAPTGWRGVLTMASGLQLDFALHRTGDGWKLKTEPRKTRIG